MESTFWLFMQMDVTCLGEFVDNCQVCSTNRLPMYFRKRSLLKMSYLYFPNGLANKKSYAGNKSWAT